MANDGIPDTPTDHETTDRELLRRTIVMPPPSGWSMTATRPGSTGSTFAGPATRARPSS